MIKKFIIIPVFLVSGFTGYSQNQDLIRDCQKLILKTFRYYDLNPVHQMETDFINSKFQTILLKRNKTTLTSDYNSEIESLFHLIYDNGTNEYEDSPDYRRLRMRRAICFASIALISDFHKAYTFIEYAKLSLLEHIDTPDDDLLEESFLGLMIIEIMLKIDENRLTVIDIDNLESYLNLKKEMIEKQIYDNSQVLIKKCRLIFK